MGGVFCCARSSSSPSRGLCFADVQPVSAKRAAAVICSWAAAEPAVAVGRVPSNARAPAVPVVSAAEGAAAGPSAIDNSRVSVSRLSERGLKGAWASPEPCPTSGSWCLW